MTVGQRIQHYRKMQGLSQEELGQKLLVSRQTVSLWENDQTLPTIDNLVRLKEIFGVTIEVILSGQPKEEETSFDVQPMEKYQFQFAENECKIIKKVFKPAFINPLFLALCYFVFDFIYEDYELLHAIRSFAIYLCVLLVFSATHRNSVWKKEFPSFAKRTYSYDVYENYVYAKIYEGDRLLCLHWIPYSAFPRICEDDELYAFACAGQWFIIRGEELNADSHLRKALRTAIKKQKNLFAKQ